MTQSTRTCKYGCNTTLGDFDTDKRKYKELDGTLHTFERCQSLKPKQYQKPLTNGHSTNELDSIVKTLQDIITELERIKNV